MRCGMKHAFKGGEAESEFEFPAVYIQVSPAAEAPAAATASAEPPSSAAAAVSPPATASSETMAASRNLPSSKT